jgi:hypothetical protein
MAAKRGKPKRIGRKKAQKTQKNNESFNVINSLDGIQDRHLQYVKTNSCSSQFSGSPRRTLKKRVHRGERRGRGEKLVRSKSIHLPLYSAFSAVNLFSFCALCAFLRLFLFLLSCGHSCRTPDFPVSPELRLFEPRRHSRVLFSHSVVFRQ